MVLIEYSCKETLIKKESLCHLVIFLLDEVPYVCMYSMYVGIWVCVCVFKLAGCIERVKRIFHVAMQLRLCIMHYIPLAECH